MRPNDDTILAPNTRESHVEDTNLVVNEEPQFEAPAGDNKKAKIAVAAGAAGVVGVAAAGGAYAYNKYHNGENTEEETEEVAAKVEDEPAAEEHHHHHHHEAQADSHENVAVVNEEQFPETHPHSLGGNNSHNDDPAYLQENDVKILSIETKVDEDGQVYHVARGTVNGHEAVFVDNGNGNVVATIVDENGDGEAQSTEVHEFHNGELSMAQLSNNMVDQHDVDNILASNTTTTTTTTTTTGGDDVEVHVVSVDNDVELGGDVVDVATVTINDTPVLFVDTEQDGEANVAIIDMNQNRHIEENEIIDVEDKHISMPTEADVDDNVMASSDLPDYSNDSDIITYDF